MHHQGKKAQGFPGARVFGLPITCAFLIHPDCIRHKYAQPGRSPAALKGSPHPLKGSTGGRLASVGATGGSNPRGRLRQTPGGQKKI